jgi:predicted dinucleotide-binding enzyme
VGAGMIGGTVARLLAATNHEVAVSNSRGPETLQDFVDQVGSGILPMTAADAMGFGDVVFIAVPFHSVFDLPSPATEGKTVVDTTNYYPSRDGVFELLERGPLTSSVLVAQHFTGARIVKAFNTLYFGTLAAEARPASHSDRLARASGRRRRERQGRRRRTDRRHGVRRR